MRPGSANADDPAERLLRDPAERRRLQASLDMIPTGTRSLLDVGCGSGAFLRLVRAERPTLGAFGVERSPEAAARAAAAGGSSCVAADAGSLPFGDASFDCASALEILEHLEDDSLARTVRELSRIASRHILVSTPHEEELIRLRCSGCRKAFNPNGHVRRVDEGFLRGLFPGWRLAARSLVWSETAPYFYRELHGLYSRLVRPFLEPPLCGTCSAETRPAEPRAAGRGLAKIVRRGLPGRRKHRWIVGLFRR